MSERPVNGCAACAYWEARGRFSHASIGLCRRRSPATVSASGRGVWPETLSTDVCGDMFTRADLVEIGRIRDDSHAP